MTNGFGPIECGLMRQVRSEMVVNPCVPGVGALIWKQIESHTVVGLMHYVQDKIEGAVGFTNFRVRGELQREILGNSLEAFMWRNGR